VRAVEAKPTWKGKNTHAKESQLLFNEGLSDMFYCCLFATALFSAARINEVCTLQKEKE